MPFQLARNALYYGLRSIGLAPGDEVVVPAYICRVVTEAIEACEGVPVLVDVEPDCSWDIERVRLRLSRRTRAVLAVHYFGQPADLSGLSALCREHGLYLIEDCAHTIDVDGRSSVGRTGDMAIFSLRKFSAAPDGALLVVNDDGISMAQPTWAAPSLMSVRAAKSMLDQAFTSGWRPGLRRLVERSRDVVRFRAGTSSEKDPPARPASLGDGEHFRSDQLNLPMSRLSRALMRRTDATSIARLREHNHRYLADRLSDIRGFQPLTARLEPNVMPWTMAVDASQIPGALQEFRSRGIPATSWSGVVPSQVHRADVPTARHLYEHLLFLPVHQDLRLEHLERIVIEARAISSAFLSRDAEEQVTANPD